MPKVKLNDKVPHFSRPATGGKEIGLTDLRGHRVVLYFYPKDSTPGCTTEGQDFRDLHDEFVSAHTIILGVSRDSLQSHEKFRQKQQFPFDLLADEDESLCRLFDVIHEKTLYGKKSMGVVRSTFIIDEQGVLRGELRNIKVKGHAARVLDMVKGLEQN